METYLQGFHEDEFFSANLLLSDIDEVMKDQLVGLESFKMEEIWREENNESKNVVDEDFQQIMSDWHHHLGSLHSTDSEELGLGLDTNLDILNNYSNIDLFGEVESSILSRTLKYPGQKHDISFQSLGKTFAPTISKDSFLENLSSFHESHDSNQKLCGLIKTDPNVIRKVTLINGEKEILGKNIIGLHCLNEIKENPDENCQVTSTVINGKRYKIIIKPKSLRVKKLSEEKIRKTLIKKLTQCHLVTKTDSKEDHIISEVCSDNFDVPVLSSDLLPSWDLDALESECSNKKRSDVDSVVKKSKVKLEKEVPIFRIKLPKLKKCSKDSFKSDEEVSMELVNDKVVEGNNLGTLLKNFEEEVAKLEKNEDESGNDKRNEQFCNFTSENIKNCLPREMINKIEALRRKKQCRIPLIQAMPTKKPAKNGTRMQDAVATMNRNKLLKLVSVGDSVQLDHDYCSPSFTKTKITNKQLKKSMYLSSNLAEKNPKKDSGMESGDVSDASEGPSTPDCLQNLKSFRQINNKVLEERRHVDHSSVTNAGVAFFRASNEATVSGAPNSSDPAKTKSVSNGNKALTNNSIKSKCNSDNSTFSSELNVKSIDDDGRRSVSEEIKKNENPVEQCLSPQGERPKKKLKLEEYLNRRQLKEKEREKSNNTVEIKETGRNKEMKSIESDDLDKANETETYCENTQEKYRENRYSNNRNKPKKEKKFWRNRSRRSSSASSRERRRSRSKSESRWRRRSSSSSNCSSLRQREVRGKQRCRRSESNERMSRRGFWSGSLSRSSSRESSTSTDYSVDKHSRNSSVRYRRRSRSRSVSRGRSSSRNRGCSGRRPINYYNSKNFNYRRSKSPFYAYSVNSREKQRQIEERRVIYVGRIEEGMTNAKLRERFSIFGPIVDISLHFRKYGDNYGFVTYAYKADAYDAVEHGNDDPTLPHYDLCFGGRRGFCKEKYADLDGMPTSYSGFKDTFCLQNSKNSFDLLLKEAQAKLKNRKKQ